jgi:NAD(P)-dependent dehydrogenase (short-subunit alcohol dehydrogenase family)
MKSDRGTRHRRDPARELNPKGKGEVTLDAAVLQQRLAPVVAFLLGDASRYMTGQTLMADGGILKPR